MNGIIRIFSMRRFRSLAILLVAPLFLLLQPCAIQAQVESGKVVGTIRDNSGASVAGAQVKVINTTTNLSAVVMTGESGDFVVTDLKPGTYSVEVEQPGFKKAIQPAFKLDVNQVVRVDIQLAVGTVNETVEVSAAEPLVESQTSSLGQVVEEQRVHELPLNGRNFIQLAYLAPGVNQGPNSGLTVQQGGIPENERASGAVQVNGLTATNNNFLLNGFDNNEHQIGFEVIQPSVDAIQEFKMQTNNFGADIGRGGAVVNVVLKSGTNQFHGSAYEFLRNSSLDAKNYFDDPSRSIAPFKRNQFGGSFGGPVFKDKTFFFVAYEGTRIRQSQTNISTVPLPAERTGNFSDLLTGTIDPVTGYDTGQIFDPLSYNPSTGKRQPFVGNVIPSNRLDSAALNLVALYPQPNLPGRTNNYLSNPILSNNQNLVDVRFDHQFSQKDSFFATFDYGNVESHRPDPFPGFAGGGNFSGDVKNHARAGGLSEVHTFSPTKINDLKISYTRYVVDARPNFAGQPISQQVGMPGIFDPNNALATGGLPFINISNLSPIGTTDFFPEFLKENNYQVQDAFTYIKGKHAFKFGTDVRRRSHGFFQTQNSRGDFSFDQQFTNDPSNLVATNAGGSSLASFLIGYPISAFRDGQKGSFGMSWWEVSGYAMDDFRITSKLTLNLGLRYDLFTPPVEQHDRLANFDFKTGKFVAPQMSGVSRSGNVVTDRNNFAPRVGFAWTPSNEKTVVRGGFGIFYDVQGNQNDAQLAYNPTGLFFSQSFINSPTSPNLSLSLSQGYPAPTYPTLANPSGRASAADFNTRTTYVEEWNLNVERALSPSMVLQVAYVGTHALKLASLSNQNQPLAPLDTNFCGPDLSNCNQPNYGRPYFSTVPNIGGIRTESHGNESTSHGLQIRFEKRFSSGWSMLNSYTWQHTIGQSEENEYYEPQNTHNPAGERGDNAPDYRHQFTSAWSYELPFGPGKKYLTSEGPLRWVAGGWQLNGIVSLYSGEAFTPLLSFDPTNTGSGAPRPDLIGNPYDFSNAVSAGCPSNHQTIQCWYNPAAFAVPALAPGQSNAHLFGNAGRGILRGPAQHNVDFSLFKDFKFKESMNLQFRAEFFNLFNTPEFGIPNNSVNATGLAGSITSTIHEPRQIQLALRLTF